MTDTSARITREEIFDVVKLLGTRSVDPKKIVFIQATVVDGIYEEPLSIERAAVAIAEILDEGEEFDVNDHPDLFDTDYDHDDELVPVPKEIESEAADRFIAEKVVAYLTERFQLR